MFDIRTIQEEVLFDKIKAARDEETANEIVYGDSKKLDDAAWVKATMKKMERVFSHDELVELRMRCQCGYGMDEKLALVQELYDAANSMEEFAGSEKAHHAGLFT